MDYRGLAILGMLGFEPRAFRMRAGCGTTAPCTLMPVRALHLRQDYGQAHVGRSLFFVFLCAAHNFISRHNRAAIYMHSQIACFSHNAAVYVFRFVSLKNFGVIINTRPLGRTDEAPASDQGTAGSSLVGARSNNKGFNCQNSTFTVRWQV